LDVIVNGLYTDKLQPVRVRISSSGEIHLPIVERVKVGGLTLMQAQEAIQSAYVRGDFIKQPLVNVVLVEKAMTSVVVLGEVNKPGTYPLPPDENDVPHALAAAEGMTENAANYVEVHRRIDPPEGDPSGEAGRGSHAPQAPIEYCDANAVVRIPLYGPSAYPLDGGLALRRGEVVVVPNRKQDIFYVVGPLKETSFIRFSLRGEDRDLGGGFILPRDREIDVVTAVVMAGYIDPINSPTTVTVHRARHGRPPLLIRVDLIEARYDPRATVLVRPGDIIYLNPDPWWWWRRTLDRIVPTAINDALDLSFERAINPGRN
jgi:polysaccharide export outer membrane protein